MNVFGVVMNHIRFNIPKEILNLTFKPEDFNYRSPINIEEVIMNKVIRSRVMIDINLVSGQDIYVDLSGLPYDTIDETTVCMEIPPDRLNNRDIIYPLYVIYSPIGRIGIQNGLAMTPVTLGSMNDVSSTLNRVMDSVSNLPPISNEQVELVGHNVIVVRSMFRMTPLQKLRCMVCHDSNLNNIRPGSIIYLQDLVLLAVKAFIYNTNIIRLDRGFVVGGQEIGSFKNIIEGYADSESMYREKLKEEWPAVAYMNDREKYRQLLKSQVCPAL